MTGVQVTMPLGERVSKSFGRGIVRVYPPAERDHHTNVKKKSAVGSVRTENHSESWAKRKKRRPNNNNEC